MEYLNEKPKRVRGKGASKKKTNAGPKKGGKMVNKKQQQGKAKGQGKRPAKKQQPKKRANRGPAEVFKKQPGVALVKSESHKGSVLLPVMPPNVINPPDEDLGVSGSFVDVMAEHFLATLFALNPPAASEIVAGTAFVPARIKLMLMWAFCSKMREVGSLIADTNDVWSMFPDYPEDAPVPVSWALFIKYNLPYSEHGVKFTKLYKLTSTYFAAATTNSHIVSTGVGVSKRCASTDFYLYALSGSEFVTTGTTTFDVPTAFQQWADTAQYMAGAIGCCRYSQIGKRAPDASAYAKRFGPITRCASLNYNAEYVPLFVVDAVAPVSDEIGLHNRVSQQTVVAGLSTVSSVNLGLLWKNYFTVLADAEFRGTIHATLRTTKYRGLATFAPVIRNLNLKHFWDACFESQKKYCSSQETAVAACIVWWTQLLAAIKESYAVSCTMKNDGTVVSTMMPLHRPFSTLPAAPAIAEYISGLGPVMDEGRVVHLIPQIDHSFSPSLGRNWLRYCVTGITGSVDDGGMYYTNSYIFPAATTIMGLAFTGANFPGSAYPLVPCSTSRRFVGAYNKIVEANNFIPVQTAAFGLPDMLCPADLVYSAAAGETVNGITATNSVRIDKVWSPTMGSGVDLNRILSHLYARSSATTVDAYPRATKLSGVTDAPITFFHYLSTTGYNILSEEIAGLAVKSTQGQTIGTYTTPTVVGRTGITTALRKVSNDYNSNNQQSGGLVDATPDEIAKEGKESAESYSWSAYITPENLMRAGKFAAQAVGYAKQVYPMIRNGLNNYGRANMRALEGPWNGPQIIELPAERV